MVSLILLVFGLFSSPFLCGRKEKWKTVDSANGLVAWGVWSGKIILDKYRRRKSPVPLGHGHLESDNRIFNCGTRTLEHQNKAYIPLKDTSTGWLVKEFNDVPSVPTCCHNKNETIVPSVSNTGSPGTHGAVYTMTVSNSTVALLYIKNTPLINQTMA